MTRIARVRPDVPNGKPVGRHVGTARHHLAEPRLDVAVRLNEPKRFGAAVRAVTAMWVSAGIVGTVALPSYGVDPDELHAGGLRAGAGRIVGVQSFAVPAGAVPGQAERHAFFATTPEELEAARKKEHAAARESAAAKQRALEAAAAGLQEPLSARPGAKAPENAAPADDGSIVSVARQYLGVPYVFGGASPSGFDCSGLVVYVFAQFGISLPHSSLQQGADGIPVAEPAPGDLVVIDGGSHIGIYTGNGNMIDAPMPGRVVNERPIYTANHYFVRYEP